MRFREYFVTMAIYKIGNLSQLCGQAGLEEGMTTGPRAINVARARSIRQECHAPMVTRDSVVNLVKSRRNRPMTTEEMVRRLSVDAREEDQFRQLLQQLQP